MAEEFTILPEFVQNELNTQVITQDDLPQRMIEANAHRWQMNQLAQQQSKEELNDQLTNMNYDTAGVWDVDLPEINNDIKGFVEWIKQNPNALLKKADNLELYQQMMQKRNDILYKIGKSKADKVIYEKQQTFIEDPKNIDYQTPNNAMILNKFYSKDGASSLMDRKWTGFAPPDTWDERSVIEYGRNKIIKTTSLNATTDYTPDTEVMGYIGTVLNTPSLANPFMHHYQSEYNMMLGNNPNQEIEVFDQESIKNAKGGNLHGHGTIKKISEITPLQLGVSNLINGLTYSKSDIKQYAEGSANSKSSGGLGKHYMNYTPGMVVTMKTDKPIGGKGKRVDLKSVGGWDVAGTSETPRNINIQPPYWARDENGNIYDKDKIGAGTWNIDVVGVYDLASDKNHHFVNADSKDAVTIGRYVKVVKKEDDGTNKTYIMRMTDGIAQAIQRMGLIFGDTPNNTQNGTTTQTSSNKDKYVFKDGVLILEKK